MLIEALPAVAERVPEMTLEVVGSPRMPIEPLLARAEVLGVAEPDHLGSALRAGGGGAAVLGRAQVIALPYRWIEGSGVLATALAQGVPPVVTAVGTFPELCAEYDLGDAVPPDDPSALALSLVRALTDPAVRARAVAGMQRARAELTWERTAQMTLDLYGRALADGRQKPAP